MGYNSPKFDEISNLASKTNNQLLSELKQFEDGLVKNSYIGMVNFYVTHIALLKLTIAERIGTKGLRK